MDAFEEILRKFHPDLEFDNAPSDEMPEETAGESEYEPTEMRLAA